MTWGNHKAIVAMTELARREGFGDILPTVSRLQQRIGKGADKFAMHSSGSGIPGPRPEIRV